MNVILGKSKTGKSKTVYDLIDKDIQDKKEVILFVPSQSRLLAENEYMKYQKKQGIIGFKITTISNYIISSLQAVNLNLSDKYISKLDRKIIILKCLNEQKDNLVLFKNSVSKEGFLDILDIYIDLCRKQNINIDDIDFGNISNEVIKEKLSEILLIYECYIKKISERFIDSTDQINLFLESVLINKDISNFSIYFDGYNNFNQSEIKLIEALEKKSSNLTITLDTDISSVEDISSNNTNEIFETVNTTFKTLLKISNKLGKHLNNKLLYESPKNIDKDISLVVQRLFSNDSFKNKIETEKIKLLLKKNIYEEIQEISKVISCKVKQGYRYNDFCIYTTDIDMYSNVVSRVMYQYGISVQTDEKVLIKDSKLCNYIKMLLKLIGQNVSIEKILEILKLELNDIEKEQISTFENYVKEFNINMYILRQEFILNNDKNDDKIYDLAQLNNIRKKVIEIFLDDSITKKEKLSAEEIIIYIYNHLTKNNVIQKFNNIIENEFEKDAYGITKSNIQSQTWDKICEIFDSISKVYENSPITINEFLNIYIASIKNTYLKTIPSTKDQVILADINTSKIGEKKICFFVGATENNLPKVQGQDILFSDSDIDVLDKNGINIKKTSISKLNMQMFNIYQAMNTATEKIYFLIPTSTMDGKSLRPSSLISKIQNITNIVLEGDITNTIDDVKIENIYSKEAAFEYMINLINKLETKSQITDNLKERYLNELSVIYEFFSKEENFNNILEYKKNDNNLSKDTLELIYKNTLNTSISKLELFKKCPFSYYMQYILKINPLKDFEINKIDIGNFMHSIIEKFSKYLMENNIMYHEIIDANDILKFNYKEVLDNLIEDELENKFKNKVHSVKYEVTKLKLLNTMQKVVCTIAKGFNQSEFIPYGYEIEFSKKGKFRPIQIELEDGRNIELIGKIDRLDTLVCEGKKYVRVIDYKSSSKDLNIKDIKEGISLQLITYINAFAENKNYLPAAMLYFNLSNKLINLKDYISDGEKIKSEVIKALRMKGIFLQDVKIIEKMDNKLYDSNERLIDISKSSVQKGSLKTLDEKQFNELCIEAKNILKKLATEVLKGVVKIDPNKNANQCKYCNYSSVCRKKSCL
ncbi:MAG: PD-(D/E)XK nuclease family protein [Clostridia bacterium]